MLTVGWRLELLGGFRLSSTDAGAVSLGRKPQALIAYLGTVGERGASRAQLVSLIWPHGSEAEGRNALRQCLHLLRRRLPRKLAESLVAEGERLFLRHPSGFVDANSFERLAAAQRVDLLLDAAALYAGDLLDGVDAGEEFERWARAERERLRDIAHRLVERLSEFPASPHAADLACALARRLLIRDPVHEGCYRALMRLYLGAGRRGEALRVYDECRQALRTELGVAPSSETAALATVLLSAPVTGSGLTVKRDPARDPPAEASNLPRPLSVPLDLARPPCSPLSYDHLLRGWQLFALSTAESNRQAREEFLLALREDPNYAHALAMVGWTHWFDWLWGWSADLQRSADDATEYARRALRYNRSHPSPHMLHGKILLWTMRHDQSLEALRRALQMAPDYAYSHFNLADALAFSGVYDEALVHIHQALALNPNEQGMFLTIEGLALYLLRELDAARNVLTSAVARNPGYAWSHGLLCATLVELQRTDEARQLAVDARRSNRRFCVEFARTVVPLRDPAQRERLARAWSMAGMPIRSGAAGAPVVPVRASLPPAASAGTADAG